MFARSTRLAILLVATAAYLEPASFCSNDLVPGDTRHAFTFLAGYSPASPTLIGTTTGQRFVLAGFEYSYRCWAWRSTSISFSPGVLPAAILLEPSENVYDYSTAPYMVRFSPAHAVYGFAVLPVGFTFDFARRHVVHPYFEIRGGVIASAEPIPVNVTNASGLNFIFDFGPGVEWKVAEHRALSFGYKFLHISNADTTAVNPGVDNSVFYAAFSFLR